MLYDEELTTNLISISQLCDQNLFVKFTKNTCKVFNNSKKCVMEGARSSDNCYKLLHPYTCVVRGIPELEKKQLEICRPC